MAIISRYRLVECQTIDGTIISAWLYEVDGPAPAIIMSHGVSSLNRASRIQVDSETM